MKKTKKLLLLFLTLAMLLSTAAGLVSCGEKKPSDVGLPTSPEVTEGLPAETGSTEVDLYADLPTGNYMTGDKPADFNILNSNSSWALVTMDAEQSKLAIDSAVYTRNRLLEDQLGIRIQVTMGDSVQNSQMLYKMVNSNDSTYDIFYNEIWQQSDLAIKGCFLSLNTYSDKLDLSKPWWYTDVIDNLTIADNCYLIAGDMNMSINDALWCMAFNEQILENYGEENLFKTVEAGNWTMEEMYRLSLDTCATGRYGIASHSAFSTALLAAADLRFTELNDEGELVRNPINDHFTTVHQYITTHFYTDNGQGNTNQIRPHNESERIKEPGWQGGQPLFTGGKATFLGGTVGDMRVYLPNSGVRYGLIPMPKWSTEQAQYISYTYRNGMICGIPSTIRKARLDRACTVLENFNAQSYRILRPVYYDTVLFGRVSLQPESREMLKIVFGTRPEGTKRLDLDVVLTLGMTRVSEICASDLVPNLGGRLLVEADTADELLVAAQTYYQTHKP